MLTRLCLLSALSLTMFTSGTYAGWRAARWLDPVLDAKDRTTAVTNAIGGFFND